MMAAGFCSAWEEFSEIKEIKCQGEVLCPTYMGRQIFGRRGDSVPRTKKTQKPLHL